MRNSGFDVLPEWVTRSPHHLTKGGAQLWLRMLFGLENGAAVREGPDANESDPVVLWAEIHRLRAENVGPDGMTWRQAAVQERMTRVTAARRLNRIKEFARQLNEHMGAETEGEGLVAKILWELREELKATELPETQGTSWIKWFPTTVLGHPMREYEPGKWESAEWPSDAETQKTVIGTALLVEASKTGNPEVIKFAAQLADVPPCEACGYVQGNCRCTADPA
jgi:hypothetical protein